MLPQVIDLEDDAGQAPRQPPAGIPKPVRPVGIAGPHDAGPVNLVDLDSSEEDDEAAVVSIVGDDERLEMVGRVLRAAGVLPQPDMPNGAGARPLRIALDSDSDGDEDAAYRQAIQNSLLDEQQAPPNPKGKGRQRIVRADPIDLTRASFGESSSSSSSSARGRSRPAAARARGRAEFGGLLDDDDEKSPTPPSIIPNLSGSSSSSSCIWPASLNTAHDPIDVLIDAVASLRGYPRAKVVAVVTRMRTEMCMGPEVITEELIVDVLESEGADEQVECGICADTGPARKTVVCTGSEAHRMCGDCANHYIADCKKFAAGGPACPSHVSGCTGWFPEGALRRLVPGETFEKMHDIMLERTIVGENYLECPRCHKMSFRDDSAGASWAHQCPYNDCRTNFCATCREPVSGGQEAHVCRANVHAVLVDDTMKDQSDAAKLEAFNKEVVALVKGADALECPRCRKLVLKDEGCNAITCRCGCNICWFCGKDTGISHGAHECTMKLPSHAAPARPGTVNNAQFFSQIDPAVLRRQKRLDEIATAVKGRREAGWLAALAASAAWRADKDLKPLILDMEGDGHAKLSEQASKPRRAPEPMAMPGFAFGFPFHAAIPAVMGFDPAVVHVQADLEARLGVAQQQLEQLERRIAELAGNGQDGRRNAERLQRQRERLRTVQRQVEEYRQQLAAQQRALQQARMAALHARAAMPAAAAVRAHVAGALERVRAAAAAAAAAPQEPDRLQRRIARHEREAERLRGEAQAARAANPARAAELEQAAALESAHAMRLRGNQRAAPPAAAPVPPPPAAPQPPPAPARGKRRRAEPPAAPAPDPMEIDAEGEEQEQDRARLRRRPNGKERAQR